MLKSIAARRRAQVIAFIRNSVHQRTRSGFAVLTLGILTALPMPALGASTSVVISQIYGAGGNSGALLQNDYVELFNLSATTQSLSGMSVQYASATGTGSFSSGVVALSGSIAPGGYFLLQLAGGANGSPLPVTPDQSSTSINMAAGGGKVILASTTSGIACNGSSTACSAAQLAQIVDLVGVGTANFYEGSGAAPATSTILADFRADNGCTDSDDNKSDFATGTPAPRNSSSPINSACSGSTGPSTLSINDVKQKEGNAGTSVFEFTVSLSSAAASDVTFDIGTADGTAAAGSDYVAQSLTGQTIAAGSLTYTFDVVVDGDTTIEPDETFFVNVTNVAGATVVKDQGTGTIQNDDFPILSIMQIQGHGAASTYAGQTVTTSGTDIVTAVDTNGFFMQDASGDGDPTTSDAIFVYTGSVPTVHLGDAVAVTGQVQEFNGSTELADTPSVSIISSGNTVPAAYVLDNNAPTTDPTTGICMGPGSTIVPALDGYQASNFACLDGMLVAMNDGVVTGATFASGADGVHTGSPSGLYATLGSQPRPFRAKGALFPGLGGSIPVWNGEPEIVEIYYGGLGFDPTNYIYNAGQHFSVTGIIQGYQGTYEIYPLAMTTNGTAPTYPIPVTDSAPGTLTIGTQNMLHFFNDTADGADTSAYTDHCAGTGSSDTCPTHAEYLTRLQKMSRQVREVLKSPVVLGVEEAENYSTLTDLANQIYSDGGPIYTPYLIPGNDPGGINVSILVRADVAVNSVTQMYKGTLTNSCSSNPPCLLNDRPPLLLDATYNSFHFQLLVIYDRSLINLGVDAYVGTKRTEQAVQVASIVQALQSGATLPGAGDAQQDTSGAITSGSFDITGNASAPLIVVGDFNAYEFTDGYVDVTGMIMGTALQSENYYWDTSGTYLPPSPALFDSGTAANPADHYSYNFSGYAQEIDHILLSQVALNDFSRISNAHGNSDVSEAGPAPLDPTTATRTSDHDGQVVTLGFAVTPDVGVGGTLSPGTIQVVHRNQTLHFTVNPDPGFRPHVSGCGADLTGKQIYTASITADCTLQVTFTHGKP